MTAEMMTMKISLRLQRGGALLAIAFLAGCASRPAKLPPQRETVTRPPVPPPGAAAGVRLPESDGAGGFRTANTNIPPAEAVWHVRSALNVAALACDDRAIVANYNALLKRQKAVLAAAYEAEARHFRSYDAKGWRSAMDGHMTRLYNFFAQPPVQRNFCAAAGQIAKEAQSVSSAEFQRFSISAIRRLDQPFQDFYRAYDAYQRDLAAWRAGGGRGNLVDTGARTELAIKKADSVGARWRVQLGAFSGWDAARGAWGEVRRRAPGLGSFSPHYEEAAVKGLVRLQIGPVMNRSDALRLCAAAAVAALDCLPVSPVS